MIEWFDDLVLGMRFKSPKARSRAKRSSALHRNSIPSPTILTRQLPSKRH